MPSREQTALARVRRILAGVESVPTVLPSSIRKPNLVAMTSRSRRPANGAAEQLLVAIGAVHFGSVEQRYAKFDCAVDHGPRFCKVRFPVHGVADPGHRHTAQTQRRYR